MWRACVNPYYTVLLPFADCGGRRGGGREDVFFFRYIYIQDDFALHEKRRANDPASNDVLRTPCIHFTFVHNVVYAYGDEIIIYYCGDGGKIK